MCVRATWSLCCAPHPRLTDSKGQQALLLQLYTIIGSDMSHVEISSQLSVTASSYASLHGDMWTT